MAEVITKFRIRAFGEGGAAATVTFRLATSAGPTRRTRTAIATLVAEGPTVTIPASNAPETPILEFPARVTVAQGNHLALDGTNVWATYSTSGDKFGYVFKPPLVAGQGPRGSVDATGELLVQAVIEPDADGDGFGDETQDGCPTQGSNQGPCDNAGPRISGVAVRGRTINYSLSEAATLTFTVEGPPGSQGARQVQAPDAPQPQPAALLALRHAARQLHRRRGRRQLAEAPKAARRAQARPRALPPADHGARPVRQRDADHEAVRDQERPALNALSAARASGSSNRRTQWCVSRSIAAGSSWPKRSFSIALVAATASRELREKTSDQCWIRRSNSAGATNSVAKPCSRAQWRRAARRSAGAPRGGLEHLGQQQRARRCSPPARSPPRA